MTWNIAVLWSTAARAVTLGVLQPSPASHPLMVVLSFTKVAQSVCPAA